MVFIVIQGIFWNCWRDLDINGICKAKDKWLVLFRMCLLCTLNADRENSIQLGIKVIQILHDSHKH
jgi:hypothetical protein